MQNCFQTYKCSDLSAEIIIFAFYLYTKYMAFGFKKKEDSSALGITGKLRLAIGTIIMLLIVTIFISSVEFRRMSTYVSDQIAENITTINLSTELSVTVDKYNMEILSAVGRADEITKSDVDTAAVAGTAARIFQQLRSQMYVYSDDLKEAYDRYYSTSLQLDSIIVNDFVDTRDWYFTVLLPEYNALRENVESFNLVVYEGLQNNSVRFDESFYRGIIPSLVSASVAILLCLLLQFFIIAYYVMPLKRMLKGMEAYKYTNVGYVYTFEGEDELQKLNRDISEIIEENQSLKKRISHRES